VSSIFWPFPDPCDLSQLNNKVEIVALSRELPGASFLPQIKTPNTAPSYIQRHLLIVILYEKIYIGLKSDTHAYLYKGEFLLLRYRGVYVLR